MQANVDHCRMKTGTNNPWVYQDYVTAKANADTNYFYVYADCWSSDGTMASTSLYVDAY